MTAPTMPTIAEDERVPVVAYGYENTRPTEGAALLMVKLDNSTDQYPELATKLVRQSDHLAALDAERAKVPQWVSVDERLPDIDVPVWLYEPGRGAWVGCRSDSGEGWLWGNTYGNHSLRADGSWSAWGHEVDDDYRPTFWQPLPALPPAPAPQGDDQ